VQHNYFKSDVTQRAGSQATIQHHPGAKHVQKVEKVGSLAAIEHTFDVQHNYFKLDVAVQSRAQTMSSSSFSI